MAVAGDLVVNLRTNNKNFIAGMNDAAKRSKRMQNVNRALARSFRIAGAAATAAGTAFIGWGIKLAAEAESAEVALATMLKSGDKASKMMGEISKFAASTPFQYMDLVSSARKLLAFGSEPGDVMSQIKMLGDLAAGSGSRMQELVAVYGKVNAIGKASLENINQMAERGLPIYKVLQQQIGLTGDELRKFISTGGVTAQVFNAALSSMTAQGGIFYGAMERQSKTLAGLWSTMKDNVAELARTIGTALVPIMKVLVDQFTAFVQGLNNANTGSKRLKSMGESVAMSFARVGDAFLDITIAFYKVKEVFSNVLAVVIDGIDWLITKVVDLLNKIPGVQAAETVDMGSFADDLRRRAARDKLIYEDLLVQKTPSEILANKIAQQRSAADAAQAGPEVKAASAQQMAIADSIGARVGQWIGKASGMAVTGAAAGVSSFAGAAGGMFGQGKQGNMAANKAIEANTVEGFKALRANLRSDPQKKIAELNKKQLDELMKGNSLTERVLGAIQSAGDLISIPL